MNKIGKGKVEQVSGITVSNAVSQWKQYFPDLCKGNPLDMMISSISNRAIVDIFKIDEWIHELHGNYEDNGYNMRSFIKLHYGKAAYDFIKRLM